jgi:hypothetical protein
LSWVSVIEVNYRWMDGGGAACAAAMIVELL